jgi:acyl carrier protein
MTQDELLAAVKDTICTELGLPADNIGMATKLENMDIDSLDVLRLAASFEKRFKVTISTVELTEIQSVGDIVTGLQRKLIA